MKRVKRSSGLKCDNIDLNEALYYLLHGKGLRALGRMYGVSHTYIGHLLQREFGEDITNPDVTSLARSLIADYKGNMEAYQYALSVVRTGARGEKFRSKSALNAATKWITLDEPSMLDTIASYYDEDLTNQVALRWYFVNYWVNQIVVDLGNLCTYHTTCSLVKYQLERRKIAYGDTQAS